MRDRVQIRYKARARTTVSDIRAEFIRLYNRTPTKLDLSDPLSFGIIIPTDDQGAVLGMLADIGVTYISVDGEQVFPTTE